MSDQPLDRITWAVRHTLSITQWRESWRRAGRWEALKTALLALVLYWFAQEQLMNGFFELAAAVVVAVLLVPLVEVMVNIFRAPTLELQHSNINLRDEIRDQRTELHTLRIALDDLRERALQLQKNVYALQNERDGYKGQEIDFHVRSHCYLEVVNLGRTAVRDPRLFVVDMRIHDGNDYIQEPTFNTDPFVEFELEKLGGGPLFRGMSRSLLKFSGSSVTQFLTSSRFQRRVSETATA